MVAGIDECSYSEFLAGPFGLLITAYQEKKQAAVKPFIYKRLNLEQILAKALSSRLFQLNKALASKLCMILSIIHKTIDKNFNQSSFKDVRTLKIIRIKINQPCLLKTIEHMPNTNNSV